MKQQARIRIKASVLREIEGADAAEIATKTEELRKELEVALQKLPVVIATKTINLIHMEEYVDGKWRAVGAPKGWTKVDTSVEE